MKRLLTLFGTVIALVALIGCEGEVTLEAPSVSYTVENDGADLALTWSEVTDADGYIIYGDDVVLDTVTTTTYTVTTPAALVEVTAYSGDTESDADQIDCAPVETASLHIFGSSDPDTTHPSGFGFSSSGTATGYSISNSNNADLIDYWIYSTSTLLQFVSPSDANPPFNSEVNATVNSGSDYNGLVIADAPGGYSTQTDIASGAVYSFWIDPDNDGWGDNNDYFGKISVDGINGVDCTLTLAYQSIAGLRWCVTP
ncbi:MAG TPA: hypothetical protein VF399_00770 [bacterium]|jgi:hypothetical protein